MTIDKVFGGFTKVLHIVYIILHLKSRTIIDTQYLYNIVSPNQL
jgi:hypothetical protein